jgi:hypothetical protein
MTMDRAWIFPLLLGVAGAGWVAACGGNGTPETTSGGTASVSSSTGSTGGAGGAGGTGGAGGAGGSEPECVEDKECPGTENFCSAPACVQGQCGVKLKQPAGTPLPSQLYGDCVEKQCDKGGAIADVPKDDDKYDDANICTVEACLGKPSLPEVPGVDCPGGKCDGTGKCAACLIDADCTAKICVQGKCVPASCKNGVKDASETDIDCGSVDCLSCDDGKLCLKSTNCKSGTCAVPAGGGAKVCAAPTCMDSQMNGKETDEDCGGPDCPACNTTLACVLPTDCVSQVCMGATCAKPTCTDAVKNGDEEGIDCGAACGNACP